MTTDKIKRVTYIINTVILLMVIFLLTFFIIFKATFMIYFSIPTMLVYIAGYFLVFKDRLDIYVVMVYFWLTLYMSVSTICMGNDYGFELYSMSMIPIIFVTEYMAFRIKRKRIKAFPFSIAIVVLYMISTFYVLHFGSVYEVEKNAAKIFWISNSLIVLSFLIFYSSFSVRNIIESENRLNNMAHLDNLTKLYNRYYMMDKLENIESAENTAFLAMIDIDDFKKINDIYGHNAGDYVLVHIADIMRSVCKKCTVSRWGGEEFLILYEDKIDKEKNVFEKLRKAIDSEKFVFDDQEIKVTVTIGLAEKINDGPIDKWVQAADEKLYSGKKSGKNKVVI